MLPEKLDLISATKHGKQSIFSQFLSPCSASSVSWISLTSRHLQGDLLSARTKSQQPVLLSILFSFTRAFWNCLLSSIWVSKHPDAADSNFSKRLTPNFVFPPLVMGMRMVLVVGGWEVVAGDSLLPFGKDSFSPLRMHRFCGTYVLENHFRLYLSNPLPLFLHLLSRWLL